MQASQQALGFNGDGRSRTNSMINSESNKVIGTLNLDTRVPDKEMFDQVRKNLCLIHLYSIYNTKSLRSTPQIESLLNTLRKNRRKQKRK